MSTICSLLVLKLYKYKYKLYYPLFVEQFSLNSHQYLSHNSQELEATCAMMTTKIRIANITTLVPALQYLKYVEKGMFPSAIASSTSLGTSSLD